METELMEWPMMKLQLLSGIVGVGGAPDVAPSALKFRPDLLSRRSAVGFVLVAALMGMGNYPARADTNVTIDRRVRSEDRAYALTFAARPPAPGSTFGHAYIIWQREDDQKKMSVADAVGFRAVGEPNKVQLVFGVPGYLQINGEANEIGPEAKFTVLVNSDAYQKALDRKAEWQQESSDYFALWNNCVGHVAAIAQATGLETSNGAWVTPMAYVEDLAGRNAHKNLSPTPAPAPAAKAPAPAPAPVAKAPTPAPARPAPRPAPRRRPTGPAFWDRGWDNGGGGGGGGGGGWSGWFGPR
jgi:hypothetical protein